MEFDYRTSTGFGEQILEGHKQNSVLTRIHEKEVSPQETESDLPVSVQESPVEVWVDSGLLQGQEHWVLQWGPKSVWRRSPLPLYPTIAWPLSNNREGTQPCPSVENWVKDLLSLAWLIRTRPDSPTVSLSYQKASTSLLPEGRQNENHNQKAHQTDHMDHNLV